MNAIELDFPNKFFDVVNVQAGLHDTPVLVIKKRLEK